MVTSVDNNTNTVSESVVVSLPDNAAVENMTNTSNSTSSSSSSSSSNSPNGVHGHHGGQPQYAPQHHMIMHHPMMVQPYGHPAAMHHAHHHQPHPHHHPHAHHHYQQAQHHQQQSSQFTSLYVGDLAPDVSEHVLAELFAKVGRAAVASIHVCRDSASFRSLGYAYVNFFNSVDAERALDTLNYSQVLGRPCRIMWSHRDPTKRKSNVGNIFVKNLDKSVDNALLFDTFSTFGNILSCKIEFEKGQSKGYGYVHFENQESSERAIQKVNGTIVLGKQISVEPFVSKVERFKEKKNENKLFIRNIDESVSAEMLEQELSKFGEIESCNIRTDLNGKPKGLGFVEFKNVEDAQKLLDSTEPITILSKQIAFDRIKNKIELSIENRQKNSAAASVNGTPGAHSPLFTSNLTLFINNIDMAIDKDVVRDEFAKHGNILGIKIKSRGFGFLSYSTQEEAQTAIEKMNGFVLGTKALSVSFSNRKEKRTSPEHVSGASSPDQLPTQPASANTTAAAVTANGHVMPYMYMNYGRPTYPYQQHYYPANGQVTQPMQPRYPKQIYNGPKPARNATTLNNTTTTPTSPSTNNNTNTNTNGTPNNNNNNNFKPSPFRKPRGGAPINKRQPYNNQQPQQPIHNLDSNTLAVSAPAPLPLTLESLLAMSMDDARDAIGQVIYNMVSIKYPEMAPKITGMILTEDISGDIATLFNLLSSGKIHDKIEEAQSILIEHVNVQEPIVAA